MIGIVALLAALIFPVLARARFAGLQTVEVSQLRQWGQAAALYGEDKDALPPLGTEPVLAAGYGSVALSASPADPTRRGIAHDYIDTVPELPFLRLKIRPYKRTYIGPWDFNYTAEHVGELLEKPGAGWLVSMTKGKPGRSGDWIVPGESYHRLLRDGAVVVRRHRLFHAVAEDGASGDAWTPYLLFVDLTDAEALKMTFGRGSK